MIRPSLGFVAAPIKCQQNLRALAYKGSKGMREQAGIIPFWGVKINLIPSAGLATKMSVF